MYDEYGNLLEPSAIDAFSSYTPDFPTASDQANSSVFSDFFAQAQARLMNVLPSTQSMGPVTGQLMDAIYAFGAGKVDAARGKLVQSFLGTNEGRKMQATATHQTIQQYLPWIIGGALLLMFMGVALGRSR